MPKSSRKNSPRYFLLPFLDIFRHSRRKTLCSGSIVTPSTENFKWKWYKTILLLLFVWVICCTVIGLTTSRSQRYFSTYKTEVREVIPLLSEQAMSELAVPLHRVPRNLCNSKIATNDVMTEPFEWQRASWIAKWNKRLESVDPIDLSLFQSLSKAEDPNIELALEFLNELDTFDREPGSYFLQSIPINALQAYQCNPLNRLEKISWNRIIVCDPLLRTWVRSTSSGIFILAFFALLCPMGICLTDIPLFDTMSDSVRLWISYLQAICARSILYTLSGISFLTGFYNAEHCPIFNAEWKTIRLLI